MKLNTHGLSHLGLRVTDLARAKRFYVDTLGCQLVREIDDAVLVDVYGILIGLYGTDADFTFFGMIASTRFESV